MHFLIGKKGFKACFFSYTIKARSFHFCIVIILLWVYIDGLMTLTLFQDHRCVRNTNCIFWILAPCSLDSVVTSMEKILLTGIVWLWCVLKVDE